MLFRMFSTTFKICVACVASLIFTGSANAVIIGTDTGQGNCIPFNCISGDFVYQQIYDANAFNGMVDIETISFYRNNPWGANGDLQATGIFTFSLSTTNALVDGLSSSADSNLGLDNTVVFIGSVPVEVLLGDTMDFVLSSIFNYDPSKGNLLLDIRGTGIQGPATASFLDVAIDASDDVSRLWNSSVDSAGLTTGFNEFGITSVPAPSTLGLLGLALLVMRRNRRN